MLKIAISKNTLAIVTKAFKGTLKNKAININYVQNPLNYIWCYYMEGKRGYNDKTHAGQT